MKMIVVFLLFLSSFPVFSAESFSDIYKNAVLMEQKGDINSAVVIYNKALLLSPNNSVKERIELKIARISRNIDDKIGLYEAFLQNNTKSRLFYLANYELGTLYYLKNDIKKTIEVFSNLSSISYGTPYYVKSKLFISAVHINNGDPSFALSILYQLLETIEDYEETSECYFLIGRAFSNLGKKDDSVEYYKVSAGVFPDSYRARCSLLELVRLYVGCGDEGSANIYRDILFSKYPGSYESTEAIKITGKNGLKNMSAAEDDLFAIKFDEVDKTSLIERIRKELKDSLDIKYAIAGDKYFVKPGIYIQLGYYTDEENSMKSKAEFLERGIGELVMYRGIGNDGYYYKLLSGPFDTRDSANQKVIEYKDKSVESFVMEISRNYE